jgi:hypothetical protein
MILSVLCFRSESRGHRKELGFLQGCDLSTINSVSELPACRGAGGQPWGPWGQPLTYDFSVIAKKGVTTSSD